MGNSYDLSEQRVVVTGGNKGIGRSIAERLVAEGADVLVTGRDQEAGLEAEASGRSMSSEVSGSGRRVGRLLFEPADNAEPEDIKRAFGRAIAEFDHVTALVNNAATMRRETILTTDFDFMQKVLAVNLVGAIAFSRLAIEHMAERGSGAIVNIGSTHAWSGMDSLFPYSISKGGLLTLTHHIARNYASAGIRCNWVTVGWVITPGETEVWKRQGKSEQWIEGKGKEVIPLGRLQEPEEIAASVAFLLSDEASQITDTELDVTGGLRV